MQSLGILLAVGVFLGAASCVRARDSMAVGEASIASRVICLEGSRAVFNCADSSQPMISFHFRNDGSCAIEDARVSLTCGCQKSTFSPLPLPPGEVATLQIRITPGRELTRAGSAVINWNDESSTSLSWDLILERSANLQLSATSMARSVWARRQKVIVHFAADYFPDVVPNDFTVSAYSGNVVVDAEIVSVSTSGKSAITGSMALLYPSEPLGGDLNIIVNQLPAVMVELR